eukprot:4392250-Amphidinium_carterae.1
MGPGVVETITIDHSINPQQRATEGSPATLSPPSAPPSAPAADHGGEETHQWVPAGIGAPVDPDDINGWFSAPWSSSATPMTQQELLSKVASLSFSSHISRS